MVRFEITGFGRETGKEYVKIYEAKSKEEAIMKASDDGIIVQTDKIINLPEIQQAIHKKKLDEKTKETNQILYKSHPAMFRGQPFKFIFCVLVFGIWGVLLIIFAMWQSAFIPWIIGACILVVWWLRCYAVELTITKDRAILRKGILSKSTNEVRNKDIKNIQVIQGIIQRIFDTGTIGISSAGTGGIEIVVSGMPRPQEIADLIRQNQ